MQANVGGADRVIRFLIGIALLSLVVFGSGSWRWLGLLGVVPIATALLRFCPLYTVFRINTAKPR
ncbi:MAG: DUF2892 domain-containing protein [Limnochordales bacterium]|nr:DUF2892 domain-containing protein [Bacillota bacterium]